MLYVAACGSTKDCQRSVRAALVLSIAPAGIPRVKMEESLLHAYAEYAAVHCARVGASRPVTPQLVKVISDG